MLKTSSPQKGHADRAFSGQESKGSKMDFLGGPHSGARAGQDLVGGDPVARMMGTYGKQANYLPGGGASGLGGGQSGETAVRGGGIRRHVTEGGLGAGRLGATSDINASDSGASGDTE